MARDMKELICELFLKYSVMKAEFGYRVKTQDSPLVLTFTNGIRLEIGDPTYGSFPMTKVFKA